MQAAQQIPQVLRAGRARWSAFWLSAPPLRALGEVLLAQLIITSTVVLGLRSPTVDAALLILVGPCCILWCAFRMRQAQGIWWQRLAGYTVYGGVIAVLPSLMVTLAVYTFIRPGRIRFSEIGFFLLWIVAFTFASLISRLGVRLLILWNRLRRGRLVWALTHAHLMVVVLGAALLSIALVIVNVGYAVYNHSLIQFSLLPMLFFIFLVTVFALLIVLPPSALFSYLFAHRTTQRLDRLAAATTALRNGDLTVRVPVQGEDEVAQLQANFNAMAANLQHAVGELQAERDTVATLLKARRELIASVSHELRTPVATLRGYLESARTHWDETPPPTLRGDLQVMEREVVHLQALIDDLFTLARAEVNRLELRCAPTDVAEVAHAVVANVAPLAWQSGRIDVIGHTAEHLRPALVDATRLEQVLQNLLHNAVRHTPPGGIVEVSVAEEPDAIALRVRDTGEGIAASDLPHIWERFYRGQNSREQPNTGTGLGLALVKELTEAMGGSVAVESTPGEGSCFTVRVPYAEAALSGGPRPPTPAPALAGEEERSLTPSHFP